jgi:hypothetical protein
VWVHERFGIDEGAAAAHVEPSGPVEFSLKRDDDEPIGEPVPQIG